MGHLTVILRPFITVYVTRVERTALIKPRDEDTKEFVLVFQGRLPEYIRTIGEYILSKVYPNNERPLQYAKCQRYGHAMKRCGAKEYTC